MQKDYLKNRRLALTQERFICGLEGIGDILVFETKKKRNKRVLQGLKRIEKIIKNFLLIRRNNPDKFERLLLSQEFFDIYSKDEKEASLRLGFDPEKYLISLSTAINQILRIHKTAIEEKNGEISSFATYHINWLLADISKETGNERFVEYLLRVLSEVSRDAVAHQDRSMHAASVHWYVDIVFNKLRQNNEEFQLEYLPLFDSYFLSAVKYIIYENQTSLFESLVSSIVDGIIVDGHEGDIWEYGHLLLSSDFAKYEELNKTCKIDDRIKELNNSINDLSERGKLDKWLEKFNDLKIVLEPNLTSEQLKKAREIEEDIKSFVTSQFKFNNLLEIVFSIGIYCLFKQKPQYIRFLWEYRQPPDSDASWIGHDVIPTSINGVLNFFYRKSSFERKFDFLEGHHGSEVYYNEYFLLLLCRVLQNFQKNAEGKFDQLENYQLPKLHIYRLSALEYSVDELVKMAGILKDKTEVLGALGFDINKKDELFKEKLIPFLESLKVKAQEGIKILQRNQHISPKKVLEFKESLLESFKKSAVLRGIFKYYGLYDDQTGQASDKAKVKFGVTEVSEKAPFFEEWHVHYSDWGENYGVGLASSENRDIFKKIMTQCKEIKGGGIDRILEDFQDLSSIVILVTHPGFYRFIERLSNFKGKWSKDSLQLNINGFEGSYMFKDVSMPVFNTHSKIKDEELVIVNKNKLGRLIQYSPLLMGENEAYRKEIFYMDIQEIAPNLGLVDRLIDQSPEWLTKIGDKESQKIYLQEKVLINISEKFEYCPHQEFEGYLVKIPALNS